VSNNRPPSPGATIREMATEKGLSPIQLAKKLGLQSTEILPLLFDATQMTGDLAAKLAELFGTNADYWLDMAIGYHTPPEVNEFAKAKAFLEWMAVADRYGLRMEFIEFFFRGLSLNEDQIDKAAHSACYDWDIV